MSDLLPGLDASTVRRLDHEHVFHSWSAQDLIDPPAIVSAKGSRFTDHTGREYLDFASQLVNVNIGHQHPDLVAAIAEAAARMTTMSPAFAVEARSQAAAMIAERAPGDLDSVFFTNGGAESNEHAIRMARLHTGRSKVLAAYRSYHGGTAGAMALTGESRRWGSEPSMPGVVHHWSPYPYRSPFHAETDEQECQRALAHLREVIELEGPEHVAAIILEPIIGTNGVIIPPDGYLAGVRALCDEFGIVMIADEVMAGFGRTGAWFAVDHWEVTPDLITFAKGVNSGYVPLGGVIVNAAIRRTFGTRVYPGGLTYQGHVLACASAVASMRIFERDGIIEHARALGADVLGPGLHDLAERHPSVGEVRGLGVFWAVELVRDRATREPLAPGGAAGADPMAEVTEACRSSGLWPFIKDNRIHVAPPCTTSADEIREGLAKLDQALTVADSHTR